jgi:hypothetical protein
LTAKDEKLTVEHLKAEASSAAEGGKRDRKARARKKFDEEGSNGPHPISLTGWLEEKCVNGAPLSPAKRSRCYQYRPTPEKDPKQR